MFFVLKRRATEDMVHRDSKDKHLVVTRDLQNAMMFKLSLEVTTVNVGIGRHETTGGLSCRVPSDPPIPSGLPGNWKIVLIDLRLA